jgi:uncharacterized protein CbrC (UPF0167 family)
MMKFAVITISGNTWITQAETISEACENFDWKYPGTVLAVMQLDSEGTICPFCGADMRDENNG